MVSSNLHEDLDNPWDILAFFEALLTAHTHSNLYLMHALSGAAVAVVKAVHNDSQVKPVNLTQLFSIAGVSPAKGVDKTGF